MSKYTTEVRYICEVSAGLIDSTGFTGIDTVLDNSIDRVFDFEFPIFDEAYRKVLEKKILRHYYTREICEETVGLWKLRLCDRLNMIMPYYNQLYKSELIKFNPLYDFEVNREHAGVSGSEENNSSTNSTTSDISKDRIRSQEATSTNEAENERTVDQTVSNIKDTTNKATGNTNGNTDTDEVSTNNDKSERWDLYSDTPQGAITGLEDGDYLTNARNIKDTKANDTIAHGKTNVNQTTENTEKGSEINSGNTTVKENNTASENFNSNTNDIETSKDHRNDSTTLTGINTITGTESYTEHVFGKQGSSSYSSMLIEFRNTFINIDAMVIEELSDLFFGLW